ncbi:MAG TPA: hypothetical protein VNS08_01555 [Ureibacillus sp.]|nr:hypothetical protein [Ureibacillus sp.]
MYYVKALVEGKTTEKESTGSIESSYEVFLFIESKNLKGETKSER